MSIKLIYPIAFVFYKITDLVIKILPIKKEQIFDSEEELMMLAEVGEEEGTLEHEESDMIQSVLEFKNKLVKEIEPDYLINFGANPVGCVLGETHGYTHGYTHPKGNLSKFRKSLFPSPKNIRNDFLGQKTLADSKRSHRKLCQTFLEGIMLEI